MKAKASSTWQGSWKTGHGTISTDSKLIREIPYSFASRFEGADGASPEELLAAAHAGCFNQALANNFGMIGFNPENVDTSVTVEMGKDEEGHPAITGLSIVVGAKVPGITEEQFEYCVERARTRCSIAKILRCEIRVSASLN